MAVLPGAAAIGIEHFFQNTSEPLAQFHQVGIGRGGGFRFRCFFRYFLQRFFHSPPKGCPESFFLHVLRRLGGFGGRLQPKQGQGFLHQFRQVVGVALLNLPLKSRHERFDLFHIDADHAQHPVAVIEHLRIRQGQRQQRLILRKGFRQRVVPQAGGVDRFRQFIPIGVQP